jgi:uncharacterized protein with von Willebrand factor type A (vWA) domain
MLSAIQHIRSAYGGVDTCPTSLRPQVITLPLGDLQERVAGVLEWRTALLDGRTPTNPVWPPYPYAEVMLEELSQLGILRFLVDNEELTDQLLRELLEGLRVSHGRHESEILAKLRELESLERLRIAERELGKKPKSVKNPAGIEESLRRREELIQAKAGELELDSDLMQRLREQARQSVDFGSGILAPLVLQQWVVRVRQWRDVAEVFDSLGSMLGRGWDLSHSVLKHTGWTEAKKLNRLIQRLPQIRNLLQVLGRLKAAIDGECNAEVIFEPVCRSVESLDSARIPGIPPEIHGVDRSGEIARMLPSESILLGHPKLRMLWHARRAERALLSYRMEGMDQVWRTTNETDHEEALKDSPRLEQGPIVVVIDTSGSMHGAPETVAKAIALEAARVAWREKRSCLLISFGGPGEISERELTLNATGIGQLLEFIGISFGGGTDMGVLSLISDRLKDEAWKRADVMIVSDGEWPISDEDLHSVEQAKTDGTRFHGIQIGNSGQTGLHVVCDHVHEFSQWVDGTDCR